MTFINFIREDPYLLIPFAVFVLIIWAVIRHIIHDFFVCEHCKSWFTLKHIRTDQLTLKTTVRHLQCKKCGRHQERKMDYNGHGGGGD